MSKRSLILIFSAIMLPIVVYVAVSKHLGNVEESLVRQQDELNELSADLNKLGTTLPNLQEEFVKTAERLRLARGRVSELEEYLSREQSEMMLQAYSSAENETEFAQLQITAIEKVLLLQKSNQGLLQENAADLRNLLVSSAGPDDSAGAIKNRIDQRLKAAQGEIDSSNRLLEDGGRLIVMYEKIWMDMKKQIDNLKDLAQGDPEMKQKFEFMELLEQLGGTALDEVRRTHDFLDGISKRQKKEVADQSALASIAR